MELFAEGKADAFLAFPPEPQELRDRNIGRVIISTVQGQAVVAISLLRAVQQQGVRPQSSDRYQALSACRAQGRRLLRRSSRNRQRERLVEAGSPSRYEYALQTLTEI